MEVQGSLAVITGAGSGIGRACSTHLAALGAHVALVDIDQPGLQTTERLIAEAGGSCKVLPADVTDESSLRLAFEAAVEWQGPLRILHNNAGIMTPPPPFPDAPSGSWRKVLEVDLAAVVLGVQLGCELMKQSGGGVIVNTASMAGLEPFPADPIYSAAKGGVVLFTRSLLTLQDEYGIRVNCVCPGIVDTPMAQEQRDHSEGEARALMESWPLIPAEQVAEALVMLVEDDSLAGQAVRVSLKGNRLVEFPRLAPMTMGGQAVPRG
ncbi:MAG: SDR family NAD(P)-dependent oxidoreductase [Dehalococcoidia bacterium]|nr:SDR family NAD(P)-dependent oxidoreductase [Dehalococcoidia bacterium]